MDSKVAAVVKGFIALTPVQRDEFVRLANEYTNGGQFTRDRIVRESIRDFGGITKVDLGPTSQGCPCCGR
ncbi:hypothetical protein ABZ568_37275 [Streptomyces olindensis]|uniref:Uncharacterized protein n=1 Tax=Streptomyces olindensis TaxID=358823 RepID=A0ABV2Y6W8_9ACTN|nr:hypothetical protein DF19_27375 [Streptomyces olindensis]